MRWFETMATNEYIRHIKKGVLKPFNKMLFQKSFHDYIIPGEKDYQKIREYIDTNPLKWEEVVFMITKGCRKTLRPFTVL